jgi:hypothetical protein
MIGLRHENGLEPARAVSVGTEDLQLVQPLHVERKRAPRAVDLRWNVPPTEREPRPFDRPTDPFSNSTAASSASSTLRPATNVLTRRRGDLAVQNRCRSRAPIADAPSGFPARIATCRARIVQEALEVTATEVPDLSQLAGLDHLRASRTAGRIGTKQRCFTFASTRSDVVALVGVAAERLLADHMLAGEGRSDSRLGVGEFGPPLSRRPMRSSSTSSRQSVVAYSYPAALPRRSPLDRVRADEPRLERRRPRQYASFLNAFEWALPMNA